MMFTGLNISTPSTYFELYDATVCGLVDALGDPKFVDIGVHGCTACARQKKASWDPKLFLQHAASGRSWCSLSSPTPAAASEIESPRPPLQPSPWAPRARGTAANAAGSVHLNFTGNSFYELSPGHPGDL